MHKHAIGTAAAALVIMTFASRGSGVHKLNATSFAAGADDAPPNEFRIFKRGMNPSEQGPVLFDDEAAKRVMQAYAEHGVDPIIDLEHLSLEDPRESRNYDPDARGAFKLELRNGELWAVNVNWTPDGKRRLAEKTQRFYSPAFVAEKRDGETPRVVRLISVGLVAQPALDNCKPLVAANRRPAVAAATAQLMTFDASSDQESLPAIAEAFGLDAGASLADVIQAAAAWVKEMQDALNGDAAPPPPDGGNSMADDGVSQDPAAMRARYARAIVSRMSAVATAFGARKPSDKALAAFRSTILRETSASTTEEATNTIFAWRKSHIDLGKEQEKIAAERAQLEASDRRTAIGELVKLGLETPATAWAKGEDGLPKVGTPSAFFAKFSLAELRERVEAGRKAKPATPTAPGGEVTAPTENATQVEVTLFNREKRVIELSTSEVERAKASCKRKFGANFSDAQLKDALVAYATMKGNQAAKAGTGKKAS